MNIENLPTPLFIAHRGFSRRFPENTLAAFAAAVDAGAQMIELDVSLSKDRQLVVMHDAAVDRTTSGGGAVRTLTLEQLQTLDAGSWFDARFNGERVPTLEQVLDLARGRILVNIEIKPEAFEANGAADAVERQVVELVRAKGMTGDVLVSSFEWQILDNLRRLDPTIALGLLSDAAADESLRYWAGRIGAYSWHPDHRILTPTQVAERHAMGMKVFPYVVDGAIDTPRMLAMGVDGLIVDDPLQMTNAGTRCPACAAR